jgi:photosystem II stability/assembly factor-like uncharacterized protein
MRLPRPKVKGARAPRRRIHMPGGKVVARLLFFQAQREFEGAAEQRKVAGMPSPALFRPSQAKRSKRPAKTASPLLAAHKRMAALGTAAAVQVPASWRPLGPFSVPHGQTYGDGPGSRPSVSGRVSAIAVDPSNPAHLLVCGGGGGVWESKDTGATWAPRTDSQPSLAMGAIAFTPSNPTIVYAGTGEGDSTFVDSPNLLGAGLLRSIDGGTTWSVCATSPFVDAGFYDIVVDPLKADHLLAATTIGLFESDNGGVAWTQRRAQRTWSLSMKPAVAGDPNSTKEVFAACADGVFRSTNGGTSWSKVNLPSAPTSFDRIEVCYAPSDGNIVYVVAAGAPSEPDPDDPTNPNASQPTRYVWRRAVANGAFSKATPPPDLQTAQAWYDWFAAVAPNNPNVLYIGGINSHRGVRSATGTWTWTKISAKASGDSIHPDQHAVAFSPADPNVVYVGCDGGIFRSPDSGVTWKSLNRGLCITEIEFLAQHPQFENWLLAGTQDNGTLRYQGQESWYHIADGDGGDCGDDFSTPYTCYHTFYGMGIARSNEGGAWASWPPPQHPTIGPPAAVSENYPNGALFYPPVEANGPVLAQAGNKLFVSRDNGSNWTKVSLPVANRELASALVMPTATRIYVGTSAGRVFRSDFNGSSWSPPAALTPPAAGFISDVQLDPANANRIYTTFSGVRPPSTSHIFRSDDGGGSWTDISAGLPNLSINAMEIDPLHPDTIFVAADLGVYRSTNAGAAWSVFNNGLPNALIKDLAFHAPSRLLRAGTQARGTWEIPVDAATLPDVEIFMRDSAVDSGRVSPSPSGVNDPFIFNAQTFWWQCQDIKVDSPPFLTPSLTGIDFELFGDDQSLTGAGIEFSNGLRGENPQRNRTVRVYVQVHNRGTQPANNVAVKVFFAPGGLSFPDLPAGFWTNFPNNTLPAASSWQPVGPHKTIPSIAPGRSEIIGFEWAVPGTAADTTALLSIISSDNDSITTAELNVANLVRNEKKCGLRNMATVNPPPVAGPPITAVPLTLSAAGPATKVSLHADAAASRIVRGMVFSKRLAKLAVKAGLKKVKLTPEDKDDLNRVVAGSSMLKKALNITTAFAPREGPLLDRFSLTAEQPENVVALVNAEAPAGYGSLFQTDAGGELVGGITLQVRG